MKVTKSILVFCALALMMSSCVFSLFPIYTPETLVYDESLLGTYTNNEVTMEVLPGELTTMTDVKTKKFEGEITMTTTPSNNDSPEEVEMHKKKAGYILKITTEDDNHFYKAHLVKIADQFYLNLFPQPINEKLSAKGVDPYADNLYPVHTFLKVEYNQKELRLINFNLERLNEMFKKNLIRLRHEIVYDMLNSDRESGDVIITAKPEEIQKFIATYAKDPSVFYTPEVYTRK